METARVIANGKEVAPPPCRVPLNNFCSPNSCGPRSVVVEHNGEGRRSLGIRRARQLAPGDRVEIVQIVAGG